MTRRPDRRNLGRGLSALLGDIEPEAVAEAPVPGAAGVAVEPSSRPGAGTVPLDRIHPNPDQPRRRFDETELDELAASIRERGLIQPVIVRPHPEKIGEFQIVAGERRWRAAARVGLHDLPALVRELDDRTVFEVAIIENVQRADLNPIEEAEGYAQLVERFGYTQETLARIVGKSRSHLANTLRLTGLPDEVRELVRDGALSAGHARAILGSPEPVALARRAVAEGLTVRAVERLARGGTASGNRPRARHEPPGPRAKDPDTLDLEIQLTAAIGMRVVIDHAPGATGTGELRIRYRSLDDLDDLCRKLADWTAADGGGHRD